MAYRRERYSWRYYRRPARRAAEGGIRAETARGSFGKSWWGQRWIEVIESFELTSRLNRGRAYARSGQVLNVRIEKGRASAEVQGSRSSPYRVTIRMKAARGIDRNELAKQLSHRAMYAAKLLAGEMPQEIERIFRKAGVALFPQKLSDIRSDCSCPDWSNPCKHIAAVYYLIGEEFDRDPSLLLKLRGIELAGLLSGLAPKGPVRRRTPMPARPLTADPAVFWGSEAIFSPPKMDLRVPTVDAPLLKQLGSFPFWHGEDRLAPAVEEVCKAAAAAAAAILLRSVRDQAEM